MVHGKIPAYQTVLLHCFEKVFQKGPSIRFTSRFSVFKLNPAIGYGLLFFYHPDVEKIRAGTVVRVSQFRVFRIHLFTMSDHRLELLWAIGLISKSNRHQYGNAAPLTTEEQAFLSEWASKTDSNRYKLERYTCKEWLGFTNILEPKITYMMGIEDLLFESFRDHFGDSLRQNYPYFLLTARYVVLGLSDVELAALKDWAALSSVHQRVFDQFTHEKYATLSIKLVKKFASKPLYYWFMEKYHPVQAHRPSFFRRLFKKYPGKQESGTN